MQITLENENGKARLTQITCSGRAHLVFSLSVEQIKTGIIAFLKDVESRSTMLDGIMLTKNQSEIKLIEGHGQFGIPFVNLYALILDDE